jgi:hypothetical protein
LNPWSAYFPEVINVNDLEDPVLDADFIGIKIGDVNGSAITNSRAPEVARAFRVEGITGLGYELYQNQPNPWQDRTIIGFYLPEAGEVSLRILDGSGRILKLIRSDFAQGSHRMVIYGQELPASGVLYYSLETNDIISTKKMILLK